MPGQSRHGPCAPFNQQPEAIMLFSIDRALLSAFQKCCDVFQRTIGLTKFRIERWAIICTLICMYMVEIVTLSFEPPMLTAMAFFTAVCFFMVKRSERHEREFVERGSIYTDSGPFLRLYVLCTSSALCGSLLFLSPFTAQTAWYCGSHVCFLVWIYVNVCVPRPPGKSKMRQWLESALTWANDALSPAPIPIRT